MRIVMRDGVEVAKLSEAEHTDLKARLEAVANNPNETYTDAEVDAILRADDLQADQDNRRAA